MNNQKTEKKRLNNKERMIKTAKVCEVITKVLYVLSCVGAVACTVLAIVLPLTNTIPSLKPAEVALIFGGAAVYCFMAINVLWNASQIFRNIYIYETPFNEKVVHYLKKTAIAIILISIIPSLSGSILVHYLAGDESIVKFDFQFVGVIIGILTLLLGFVFKYGVELQKKEDETLW